MGNVLKEKGNGYKDHEITPLDSIPVGVPIDIIVAATCHSVRLLPKQQRWRHVAFVLKKTCGTMWVWKYLLGMQMRHILPNNHNPSLRKYYRNCWSP